jgi:pyrroloquinoline quinone biosynthesis protein D
MNRRFRMQWEEAQNCHVLLYPEGMVKLNLSASEILKCCDGTRSVNDIVTALEAKFNVSDLRRDIEAMLQHAYEQNWVV